MKKPAFLTVAAAVAASSALLASAAVAALPGGWEIGPIIRSKNHSVGMPLQPTPTRGGWYIDMPYPDERAGHVHYVTFDHGSLTGKSQIVMRYRIDAEPGVRIVPRQHPELQPTLSLYFQRAGDNWSGRGPYETYRWYALPEAMMPLTLGEHEIVLDFDRSWKAVMQTTASSDPQAFRDALADADRVGFVLGSSGGRGHGVYATGPARLTVTRFEVR